MPAVEPVSSVAVVAQVPAPPDIEAPAMSLVAAAAALARLYVPDPVARSGLWSPVAAAVRDAVAQARGLIEAEYGNAGEGEEAETKIDLPSDAEVAAALARVLV